MKLPRPLAVIPFILALAASGCASAPQAAAPTTAPSAPTSAAAPATSAAPTTAAASNGETVKLTLAAYSTPREAYAEIIAAFARTPAGAGITFDQSYGASGEQSRAVESGLPADIVAFSLESDVTRLVKANKVAADWNKDAHKGMVTDSVVVFGVRKGNPKNIKTWDDLVKPGIEVITPNPFSSGGARWNVMAAYGAQIKQGKSHDQAVTYLMALFKNVPVQDKSAREQLQTFVGGKGDVMISYENEAITAQQKNQELDYVIPDQTILIENPVAVTSTSAHPLQARAFVDYLRSPEAQRIFSKKGYRPLLKDVLAESRSFPTPPTLFTILDFGGWKDVSTRFFAPDNSVMADVERSMGVSTGS